MILSRNQDKLNLTLSLAVPPAIRIVAQTEENRPGSWEGSHPQPLPGHPLGPDEGGVTHLIPNAPTFPTLLSAVILAPRECAEELTRLVAIQEGQKPPSLPKLVLLTP